MRVLDTLAAQVIAWAVAIALVVGTLLAGSALIQSNSRSDQDMCIQSGGTYTFDSTSPVANGYKESCAK